MSVFLLLRSIDTGYVVPYPFTKEALRWIEAVLLKQVYEISKRYEEIERITGDNFNIFKILGVQNEELSHSIILKMFLDPEGVHGQGNLFLKHFLITMLADNYNDSYLQSVKISREFPIENGRLDIYIRNDKFALVIENKIHAEDGDKQIEKYADFLYRKHKEDNYIIYLTLDGKEPSRESASRLDNLLDDNNVICKSYRDHIIDWLELCLKESHRMPLLRETIVQYINIIKILTGQTRSRKMADEIFALLKDPDNIKAAFDIANLVPEFRRKLVKENLLKPLADAVKQEPKLAGLEMEEISKKAAIGAKWFGFSFIKKDNWKRIKIRFEFGGDGFNDFYYGIWGETFTLAKCLLGENIQRQEKQPIIIGRIDGCKNWITDGVFFKLASPDNEVVALIVEKLKEIIELLEIKAKDIEL